MRATQEQYEIAVEIYNTKGVDAVYQYADQIGLDEYENCVDCENTVPVCEDGYCFICGSKSLKSI